MFGKKQNKKWYYFRFRFFSFVFNTFFARPGRAYLREPRARLYRSITITRARTIRDARSLNGVCVRLDFTVVGCKWIYLFPPAGDDVIMCSFVCNSTGLTVRAQVLFFRDAISDDSRERDITYTTMNSKKNTFCILYTSNLSYRYGCPAGIYQSRSLPW